MSDARKSPQKPDVFNEIYLYVLIDDEGQQVTEFFTYYKQVRDIRDDVPDWRRFRICSWEVVGHLDFPEVIDDPLAGGTS